MLVWSLVKVVCHGLCYLSLKTAVLSDSVKVKSDFLCYFTHERSINIYKIFPTRILLTHERRNYLEITQIYDENHLKWNLHHGLDKNYGWNAKSRHLQIHLLVNDSWFTYPKIFFWMNHFDTIVIRNVEKGFLEQWKIP